MKPERRARFAAAVTLSKGKMYEYGVPEDDHIALPEALDLEMQFPLAVGTVGDFASEAVTKAIHDTGGMHTPRDEVVFSAQVLQAFDDSLLNPNLSFNLRLLAAAGFYLGDIPGNAAVMISKLAQLEIPENDPLALAAKAALDKPWSQTTDVIESRRATAILDALREHFKTGKASDRAIKAIEVLRNWAYANASAHNLLMADLLGAVSATRIANSAWTLLPQFSELNQESWLPYLSRPTSIKEMWPSQRMLGEAGLYRGQSSVIQMPTSAGKSRATELIIRSAFLSSRTKLALVIAPFRALCQEIASDLEKAFRSDGYSVNQLSDALQADIELDIFDVSIEAAPLVVVLTPEKLLYTLRQEPDIVEKAGLVVYDEGHQFDTGARGVTYELLLTSIKRLLSDSAQTVLISAVIQNAAAVATWLLNEARVVSDKSLQARRLIAFASLPQGKDGQLQFNVASDGEQNFFVPRVIVPEQQRRLPTDKKDRYFPTQESGSIALYLGLRLVQNGGVAIYAGRKVSASKIVRDAVEQTFRRGISQSAPSAYSDSEEIRRFVNLYSKNFGAGAYLTKGAALGIFAHHGNTPQGIRTAIEHAMRQRFVRLVVCTSTLAQGVNLPIRYLLVTSAMQGRELIKARDFHNLMGRAGRAGMYGEGTVIFTDHRLYDERSSESRRWKNSVNLINPSNTEPTGSTLLSLFDPMKNETGTRVLETPSPAKFASMIVDDWEGLYNDMANIPAGLIKRKFSANSLREQLKAKKKIIEAIESFLMTYRSDVGTEDFIANAKVLASETLAFSLASNDQRVLLKNIFESVAQRIEMHVPNVEDQRRFGRTLLGVDHALAVETWVVENEESIGASESADDLFELLWPLFTELSSEKRLTDTVPEGAVKSLAEGWMAGRSFAVLLQDVDALDASYPYGKYKKAFDLDLVVDLCEQTFGFEFSLLLASVKESFVARTTKELVESHTGHIDLLQKRLKYGLPDQDSISYYEAGFSERVIAQALSEGMIWSSAKTKYDSRKLIRRYPNDFAEILHDFPSYFTEVYDSIVTS
ncbi:DEAD/DEAH box helicase [Cupriavidus necator]